jgi:hypothetical protein
MTVDNDFNMVKPVEVSQNIVPMTAPNGKKQQKQKQRWQKRAGQNNPEEKEMAANPGGEDHLIDYRA